jgi:nucleotide-binding universal stress UspA family protein
MPTHGRGPFRRFLLGSVTAKVLHDADCPVWTGAHLAENAAAELQMIRHVLCAVDHSDASDRALAWAAGFAGEFKSVLTVVRATPPLPAPDDVLNPDWEDARREEAEKQIRCLQAKIGTHANILVEEGDPAEIVARAALERRADLVVIGRSHKKSGLGRAQEHAYQIVRDSPCPVVSI